jgi:hypothetical protein
MKFGISALAVIKPDMCGKAALLTGGLLWLGLALITGTLCWFQGALGVPCPSCGTTRAAVELFRGNLAGALYWHPLILITMVILPYFALRFVLGRCGVKLFSDKYILLGVLFAYLFVFAVRMIMLFPNIQPMVPLETALWRQILGLIKII